MNRPLDHAGRPTIELYVGVSTAEAGFRPAGIPIRVDALAGEKTGRLATDLEVVAAEDLSGSGVDVLLGRDILRSGLLVYDGPGERFTLAIEPLGAQHP